MEANKMGMLKTFIEGVVLLASFIGALIYFKATMKETIKEVQKEDFDGVRSSIDELKEDMNQRFDSTNEKIDKSDMEACQNFLVHCLTDFDKGIGDSAMVQRFWKQYDYYIDHDGNSYIKSRVEDLKAQGKLRKLTNN